MQMMDCVEVIVEKESYAREGVHKGMQGWICYEQEVDGYWLVNFPQYGEKNDIAEIDIKEEDLKYLPNGMNVKRNEQIKAQFDALEKGKKAEDISDYMIDSYRVKKKKKKPTKSRVDVRTIVITAIVDFLVGLALLLIDKHT